MMKRTRARAGVAAAAVLTALVACSPTSPVSEPSVSVSQTSTGATSSSAASASVTSATSAVTSTSQPASSAASTTTSTPTSSVSCPPASTASVSATALPSDAGKATLVDIRATTGTCGDEVIFDIDGVRSVGYRIGYQEHLLGIGKGDVIPVKGKAVLVVSVTAPAYDAAGEATYEPKDPNNLVSVSGLTSVQQVVWAGSFEGSTLVGIGLDKVHPFKVVATPGKHVHLIVEIHP
ncbi:MAG TPA: hypothetical protein VHO26_05065 [Propionibacteriaceae bacterium]|nr:hypothetical protein [Propionibacteriaceae bacterium]